MHIYVQTYVYSIFKMDDDMLLLHFEEKFCTCLMFQYKWLSNAHLGYPQSFWPQNDKIIYALDTFSRLILDISRR